MSGARRLSGATSAFFCLTLGAAACCNAYTEGIPFGDEPDDEIRTWMPVSPRYEPMGISAKAVPDAAAALIEITVRNTSNVPFTWPAANETPAVEIQKVVREPRDPVRDPGRVGMDTAVKVIQPRLAVDDPDAVVPPGESASFRVDLLQSQIRGGWQPGPYQVYVQVHGLLGGRPHTWPVYSSVRVVVKKEHKPST